MGRGRVRNQPWGTPQGKNPAGQAGGGLQGPRQKHGPEKRPSTEVEAGWAAGPVLHGHGGPQPRPELCLKCESEMNVLCVEHRKLPSLGVPGARRWADHLLCAAHSLAGPMVSACSQNKHREEEQG